MGWKSFFFRFIIIEDHKKLYEQVLDSAKMQNIFKNAPKNIAKLQVM